MMMMRNVLFVIQDMKFSKANVYSNQDVKDPNCDYCFAPYVCAICKSGFTIYNEICTDLFLILGITLPIAVSNNYVYRSCHRNRSILPLQKIQTKRKTINLKQ